MPHIPNAPQTGNLAGSVVGWTKLIIIGIILGAVFGVFTVTEAGHYLAGFVGMIIHGIAVAIDVVKTAVGDYQAR